MYIYNIELFFLFKKYKAPTKSLYVPRKMESYFLSMTMIIYQALYLKPVKCFHLNKIFDKFYTFELFYKSGKQILRDSLTVNIQKVFQISFTV